MKIKMLVTSLTLLLPLFAQAEVQLVEAGAVGQCKKLDHQVCTSTKTDADEVCLERHKESAAEVGADAIVVIQKEETRQRRPSLTGTKTVIKTDITADYFDCGLPEAPVESVSQKVANQVVIRDLYTIEDRLNVLETLKAKGLVSDEEYNQKRQDILSDL
ncbi:MAG: hypothetical protein CMI09_03220 [Oceanospirillaceae bacterium]|nr:hypothetical protein [Oceanospirillaceae bacterium]